MTWVKCLSMFKKMLSHVLTKSTEVYLRIAGKKFQANGVDIYFILGRVT